MTPQRLWADIEPAPEKRPRRRPGRALIRAAEEMANTIHGALVPELVGAYLEIEGPTDIRWSGRHVWLTLGPRKYTIVVRCDQ